MENNSRQYAGLDVLKFVCSILVIMIHFFNVSGNDFSDTLNFCVIEYFTRVSVPVFFVISSFLIIRKALIKKDDNKGYDIDHKYVLKKCFNYFRLYLIWTFIYLFFIIKSVLHGRKTVLLIIRDFFFTGSYLHLWYLPSIIVGILIVTFLVKKGLSFNSILILAFIFYIIGLSGHTYYGLTNELRKIEIFQKIYDWYFKIFYTTRNGLFEGFIFCAVGLKIAEKENNILSENSNSHINNLIFFAGFVISLIIVIFEANYVRDNRLYRETDFYLFTVLECYFLVRLFININISESKLTNAFRAMSSIIYFIHMFIGNGLSSVLGLLKIQNSDTIDLFLPTLVLSVILSFVLYKISNIDRFKVLKKLYS